MWQDLTVYREYVRHDTNSMATIRKLFWFITSTVKCKQTPLWCNDAECRSLSGLKVCVEFLISSGQGGNVSTSNFCGCLCINCILTCIFLYDFWILLIKKFSLSRCLNESAVFCFQLILVREANTLTTTSCTVFTATYVEVSLKSTSCSLLFFFAYEGWNMTKPLTWSAFGACFIHVWFCFTMQWCLSFKSCEISLKYICETNWNAYKFIHFLTLY